METLYAYCAVIGVALLIAQFLLSLIGFGHHADFAADHDLELHGDADGSHSAHFDQDGQWHDGQGQGQGHDGQASDHGGRWFVGMLSFRALVAALAVFGLVGLGLQKSFQPPKPGASFVLALMAGGGVLNGVSWLLRSVYRLRSDGTVHIERSVGQPGSVYLTIPARKLGTGKITVKVQDRTMEYAAMTSGEAIPTGAPVVVRGVLTPRTVEVARAERSVAPIEPAAEPTPSNPGLRP